MLPSASREPRLRRCAPRPPKRRCQRPGQAKPRRAPPINPKYKGATSVHNRKRAHGAVPDDCTDDPVAGAHIWTSRLLKVWSLVAWHRLSARSNFERSEILRENVGIQSHPLATVAFGIVRVCPPSLAALVCLTYTAKPASAALEITKAARVARVARMVETLFGGTCHRRTRPGWTGHRFPPFRNPEFFRDHVRSVVARAAGDGTTGVAAGATEV